MQRAARPVHDVTVLDRVGDAFAKRLESGGGCRRLAGRGSAPAPAPFTLIVIEFPVFHRLPVPEAVAEDEILGRAGGSKRGN